MQNSAKHKDNVLIRTHSLKITCVGETVLIHLRKGNVFTSVYREFCSRWGRRRCTPPPTPPGRPSWTHTHFPWYIHTSPLTHAHTHAHLDTHPGQTSPTSRRPLQDWVYGPFTLNATATGNGTDIMLKCSHCSALSNTGNRKKDIKNHAVTHHLNSSITNTLNLRLASFWLSIILPTHFKFELNLNSNSN